MTREPIGYTDLTHAVLAFEIGTTRLKSTFDDVGESLFALSVRGSCAGCDQTHEYAMLLTQESAVGVIAQLTHRLTQSGASPHEVARQMAAENARLAGDDDSAAGGLVPGCRSCGRAQPECICGLIRAGR